MRLRRAVPKFPAKSSAPPRLPLRKNRSLRTRSESTLPQLLIPLHFKSFISNVYKKPGGGVPFQVRSFETRHPQATVIPSAARNLLFLPSVSITLLRYLVTSHLLRLLCTRRNARKFNLLMGYFTTRVHHGGGGYFARSSPYLITSLLLCFRLLFHSNKSGCSRVMRSHMGWNWNQPASGMPTCECVSLAVS